MPDSGRVLQLLQGGVVRVGEVDLPFGAVVQVGSGTALVVRVGHEQAGLAMLQGRTSVGDMVTAPQAPHRPRVAPGRVVGALGEARDGGEPLEVVPLSARRRPVRLGRTTPQPYRTGLSAIDLMAPMQRGAAMVLSGPSDTALLESLLAVLTLPRDERVVVVMPGAPRNELGRVVAALRSAGRLEHTMILWTSPTDPPMATVHLMRVAVDVVSELCDAHPALLVVHGLARVAAAQRTLARPLSLGGDPFGWPFAIDPHIEGITELACSVGATVLATAMLDAPGLEDHVVPWFDVHVPLAHAPRGMLPRPRVDAVCNKLRPLPSVPGLDAVRQSLVADARRADLRVVLGEQGQVGPVWAALDQPAGVHEGVAAMWSRVQQSVC